MEVVKDLHTEALEAYGGQPGVDEEKLVGIVYRPRQLAAYQDPTLFECAARYGYAIARGHGFSDGNKRTAASAVDLFLYLNGYLFDPDEDKMIEMFEGIAAGSIEESVFREWIQDSTDRPVIS